MKKCKDETWGHYLGRRKRKLTRWWNNHNDDVKETIGNACVLTFIILGFTIATIAIACIIALILQMGWVGISILFAVAIIIFMTYAAIAWTW